MSTPADNVTFGIDLGGTSIRLGLYSARMDLLSSRSMPTEVAAGPQFVVEQMAGRLSELLREQGADAASRVLGIGIGSPGPINLRTGVLGLLPNLPGWQDFPLRDALAEATGLPVILESDANAAAIAEWKLGAGRESGLDSMAMITLGTGVGSGLILGGRIWHGMFGMGGEVGHAVVQPGGRLCGCGTRGCLEPYASAYGLLHFAREVAASADGTPDLRALAAQPGGFTPLDVALLAEERNDPAARLAFAQVGYYLGLGIAGLTSILDLPMIVIGGGVASAFPLFAPAMFESVRANSVVYRLATPTQLTSMEEDRTFIRPAALGAAAGLLGAGLLPRLQMAVRMDAITEKA